ncbi:hypothetical protein HPB51_003287 [Rhipicephalus microplus]|uniref:Uncharacterized protein n=1 Tax=Rhipicephalus microplus TaxID=6941 RepID=A0A9J6EWA2_RHIMP|nr:hypothetical protein HPB51_003287 [Rhipicephalus microplus]
MRRREASPATSQGSEASSGKVRVGAPGNQRRRVRRKIERERRTKREFAKSVVSPEGRRASIGAGALNDERSSFLHPEDIRRPLWKDELYERALQRNCGDRRKKRVPLSTQPLQHGGKDEGGGRETKVAVLSPHRHRGRLRRQRSLLIAGAQTDSLVTALLSFITLLQVSPVVLFLTYSRIHTTNQHARDKANGPPSSIKRISSTTHTNDRMQRARVEPLHPSDLTMARNASLGCR